MEQGSMVGQSLGHYRVTRLIGRGGMATVFLANDVYLNREVALKVFQAHSEDQVAFLRRFEREAQVVARLEHPNILSVYEYGRYEGMAYFAMPYLAHGSLRSYLKAQQKLSPRDALALLAPILRALQYAHDRGLIHRDIKPDNMLFKADHSLALSDFGLVKVLADEHGAPPQASYVTHTTSILGTPQYMSPEQIQGRAVPASDIYSMGVVFYELLAGSPPFVADTAIRVLTMHLYERPPALSDLNPAVSPDLEDVVMHALEKDVERRYERPLDFLYALMNVILDRDTEIPALPYSVSSVALVQSVLRRSSGSLPYSSESSLAALRKSLGEDVLLPEGPSSLLRKQTQLSTAVLPATMARYATQQQPPSKKPSSRFASLVFLVLLLVLVPLVILWSLPLWSRHITAPPPLPTPINATDYPRSGDTRLTFLASPPAGFQEAPLVRKLMCEDRGKHENQPL